MSSSDVTVSVRLNQVLQHLPQTGSAIISVSSLAIGVSTGSALFLREEVDFSRLTPKFTDPRDTYLSPDSMIAKHIEKY